MKSKNCICLHWLCFHFDCVYNFTFWNCFKLRFYFVYIVIFSTYKDYIHFCLQMIFICRKTLIKVCMWCDVLAKFSLHFLNQFYFDYHSSKFLAFSKNYFKNKRAIHQRWQKGCVYVSNIVFFGYAWMY